MPDIVIVCFQILTICWKQTISFVSQKRESIIFVLFIIMAIV